MSANRQRKQSAEPLLAVAGDRLEIGSDRPFLLSGEDGWYVSDGNLDVFSVPMEGEEAVGSRSHLFRAKPGQLLLGVGRPVRPLGLVAVGTSGTRLIRVDRSKLVEMSGSPESSETMVRLLEGWIALLCESLTRGLPPEDCRELDPGELETPRKEVWVRPKGDTLWIRHEVGRSLLLGDPALEINGKSSIPLSRHVWLEVGRDSRMRAERTAVLLGRGEAWGGLDQLHEIYLDAVIRSTEQQARRERRRLRLRAAADRRTLTSACTRIAEALDPQAAGGESASATEGAADPLLDACRLVGKVLGVTIEVPPTGAEDGPAPDPLMAIAKASRLRLREVLLREHWWRHDGGPFLAWTRSDQEPVALLPSAGSRYMIQRPGSAERERVTAAVAESLEPVAFTFYRPFPDRAINLFGLLRFGFAGCWRDVAIVLLMGAGAGLLGLMTPLATQRIFNDLIPGAARTELLQVTVILVVIALANAMFNVTGALSQSRLEGRTGAAVQSAVWDRLLSLPMPFFRPFTAGDLASRAMGIETIRQVLAGKVIQTLIVAAFSLFHFGLMFRFSSRLALWAMLLIVIAVIATLVIGRLQMLSERQVAAIRDRLSGTVLQILSSIAKLRVGGAEIRAFAVWAEGFSRQRRFQVRARSISNVLASFNSGYPIVTSLVLYAVAAPMLGDPNLLRTGDFLAFMASFGTSLTSMLSAGAAINLAASVVPLYEQAKPILSTLPEVDGGTADPGKLAGNIDVHHLSFRYQADGPLVLNEVSLNIRAGQFVALIGPSGSGKSTLMRLLLGFEEPASGSIYYDGQQLANLDRQAIRSQIGVVLQNGRLMAGDLFTNIVGSVQATQEEAWEAARMAGLDTDIRAMPMGLHTIITQGGGTLSGGQRQRLMIARALIRKPRVLFFDEATSALDNRTQAIVTDSLDRLQATRIVIAHRLSTIQNADRIFVIDRGRLVESGTYDQLFELGGVFRQLAERQMA